MNKHRHAVISSFDSRAVLVVIRVPTVTTLDTEAILSLRQEPLGTKLARHAPSRRDQVPIC